MYDSTANVWEVFYTGPNGVGLHGTDLGGDTTPSAINSSGEITGYGYTSPVHPFDNAFVTGPNATGVTDLAPLAGYTYSYGQALNSAGVVVGRSTVIGGRLPERATEWINGQTVDLNTLVPGLSPDVGFLGNATGITDNGYIVGDTSDGRAFLLTPIPAPEPSSISLLCVGGIIVAFNAIRRRRGRGNA